MQSNNFDFLFEQLPELGKLGELSEQYAYADPASSGVKLRLFGETFTKIIYRHLNLPFPNDDSFIGLLEYNTFRKALPKVIISKLHILRKTGNKAAHSQEFSPQDAIDLLKTAFDLGLWIHKALFGGKADIQFIEPQPEHTQEKLDESLLTDLNRKDEEINRLLEELEEAQKEAKQTQATNDEIKQLYSRGQRVANELAFDEATTRRLLIDEQLNQVGWKAGVDGANTSEVSQEEQVDNQPTETAKGYADYVLWDDDGKPLAVIEAKKTAISPQKGKKQAVLYADGMEEKHKQRPVIFYTNGYDIYIWNDKAGEGPRKIYGFYSKDSLQYLLFQRSNKEPAFTIDPKPDIAGRPYQLEAIKRIIERFANKERKALIVQATGTGKTRVAVSLCEALIRKKWVKRVLFLCDRRELRKQAKRVFAEFIPGSPLAVVSSKTARDRDKHIYLSTYPAMMKIYQTFDVGFFDLIIADESHRSIYNVYSELFKYFDALQIGLTATPVDFINRNTFALFNCRDGDPTTNFSYEDAINNDPPYLVPFKVYQVKTQFQREGIKYFDMTPEQRKQLEEQVGEPESVDYDSSQLDKFIFNRDTNREILRNLMENGIRDKTGMHPGKSIIFARNHNHAVLLGDLFNEMYPQYGGKFCDVIDNYNPRAESLIDDFKGIGNNPDLFIAISVDMMDTGIDVPEVVNLVFAKPVKSFVKFWQMIGRGTRLCSDLFGKGKDKTDFRIFDHCSNFEYFDLEYRKREPSQSKSMLQLLFESRVELGKTALHKFDQDSFQLAVGLMQKDINALESVETVAVKEEWKTLKSVNQSDVLHTFSPHTRQLLVQRVAPLMSLRNIRGQYDAYDFDLLIARTQVELLNASSRFQDFKDEIVNRINSLQRNLIQVKTKSEWIQKALTHDLWQNTTVQDLENLRVELRGIMKYHQHERDSEEPLTIDVTEIKDETESCGYTPKNMQGVNMAAYKKRIESVLNQLFENNETLKKIKSGEPVDKDDLESLTSLVLMQHPDIDLETLSSIYPDTAGHLDAAIRRVIGLDKELVDKYFTEFIQKHPQMNSQQIKFMDMLKNHITKNGGIKLRRLYDSPFTSISSDGPDGLFASDTVDELIELVKDINKI